MPTPAHTTQPQVSTGDGDESNEAVTKPSSQRERDMAGSGDEDTAITRPVPLPIVINVE